MGWMKALLVLMLTIASSRADVPAFSKMQIVFTDHVAGMTYNGLYDLVFFDDAEQVVPVTIASSSSEYSIPPYATAYLAGMATDGDPTTRWSTDTRTTTQNVTLTVTFASAKRIASIAMYPFYSQVNSFTVLGCNPTCSIFIYSTQLQPAESNTYSFHRLYESTTSLSYGSFRYVVFDFLNSWLAPQGDYNGMYELSVYNRSGIKVPITTAFANSTYSLSYKAALATDNNPATRWSSSLRQNGAPISFFVVLTARNVLSSVALTQYTGQAKDVRIRASSNGRNFTVVTTATLTSQAYGSEQPISITLPVQTVPFKIRNTQTGVEAVYDMDVSTTLSALVLKNIVTFFPSQMLIPVCQEIRVDGAILPMVLTSPLFSSAAPLISATSTTTVRDSCLTITAVAANGAKTFINQPTSKTAFDLRNDINTQLSGGVVVYNGTTLGISPTRTLANYSVVNASTLTVYPASAVTNIRVQYNGVQLVMPITNLEFFTVENLRELTSVKFSTSVDSVNLYGPDQQLLTNPWQSMRSLGATNGTQLYNNVPANLYIAYTSNIGNTGEFNLQMPINYQVSLPANVTVIDLIQTAVLTKTFSGFIGGWNLFLLPGYSNAFITSLSRISDIPTAAIRYNSGQSTQQLSIGFNTSILCVIVQGV